MTEGATEPATNRYADVGSGVAAILEAAEQAADQIRREGESNARDLRLAAESYGKRQRQEADAEGRKLIAAAEERSREILAGAELEAAARVAESEGRLRALSAEIRSLESKRERVAEALRSITTHIEQALGDEQPARSGELPDALMDGMRRDRR